MFLDDELLQKETELIKVGLAHEVIENELVKTATQRIYSDKNILDGYNFLNALKRTDASWQLFAKKSITKVNPNAFREFVLKTLNKNIDKYRNPQAMINYLGWK